jgi:putative NADH-flavin reductase
MRAAIFGIHGFAGSAIARELRDRGHTVSGITRTASDRSAPEGVAVRVGSILDSATVDDVSAHADWIVVAVSALLDGGSSLADAVPSS